MPLSTELRARKTPRQARSRQTVEAILTAAAQVFAQRGYAATTTNHIAARAGVSIGSLYQYFGSKDAILLALAERHAERVFSAVLEAVGAQRDAPARTVIRVLAEALVHAHQIDPRLHRVLFEEARPDAAFRARLDALEARALALAAELIAARADELAVTDAAMAGLLVVQVLEGVTHQMSLRHPELLGSPAFRDELVRLLEGYLLG